MNDARPPAIPAEGRRGGEIDGSETRRDPCGGRLRTDWSADANESPVLDTGRHACVRGRHSVTPCAETRGSGSTSPAQLMEPRTLSSCSARPRTDVRITVERLPEAVSIRLNEDALVVQLDDGRSVQVPLDWFPWLLAASESDRASWELVGGGIGIYWPLLAEDLFVLDLLLPQGPGPGEGHGCQKR